MTQQNNPEQQSHYGRRQFLRSSLAGTVAMASGSVLAACGSPTASTTTTRASSPKPRRGGSLTVGMTGGSSTDTLDAQDIIANTTNVRVRMLYESFLQLDPQARPQLVLAEEMTPNSDATVWTVRVRPDVTFHNGKTLTADDVIFSFQRIMDPKLALPGAPLVPTIDVAGMRKLDSRTVAIPFKTPFAIFPNVIPSNYFNIVPVDYDPTNPVGTGAFRYKSFNPAISSTFVRYDNYWQSGLPYLDEVIVADFPDETSQLDALVSGQIQAAPELSIASVTTARRGGKAVLIDDGGFITPFTMRVDVPPFNDVLVRQAMRAVVNRGQMRELVFGGYGTIGNDITSIWDPEYDHSIPQREHDPDLARYLLKKAGQEHLTVQLTTSDVAPGCTLAAQVLAQQATAAGIKINLQQVTPTEFYGPKYLKWTFAQDSWIYSPYLPQVSLAFLPTSPFNETHFNDSAYNKLYSQAVAEVDVARQTELAHEIQLIDYDIGGYIIPYFLPNITGFEPNVENVERSKPGLPFANDNVKVIWLS
jgi:peptide/nickel transport system substrate-binding protein